MIQIFSGILLFFGAFPLLISRISNYETSKPDKPDGKDKPAEKTKIEVTAGENISIFVNGKVWEPTPDK